MLTWEKKGLIFHTENNLPEHCIGFAQGPQAIELHDRIRVYFSTRELDSSNKYLSHVSFVDFDKTFRQTLHVNKSQVLSLGVKGSFDEHGIFPFHPFKVKDKIFGYTTGWNRKVSVSADASIGLAISEDNGVTFNRLGDGPILSAILNEPFLVGDPYIKTFRGEYHMWYIFGTQWVTCADTGARERVYKIAHAISHDGIKWKRDSKPIVNEALVENECQAMPTVFARNGLYHMYFCFRNAFNFRTDHQASYKIGYAYSDDLVTWHRDDERAGISTTPNSWDSDMMCYPNIIEVNDSIYMLYNGNQFGRKGFGIAKLIENGS